MRIKVLSSAVDDLHAGRMFYERQGEGLGEYFFDSLFSDIDALALYAGIHPKVLGYHRLLSKRFPYAVYYMLDGDLAVVMNRAVNTPLLGTARTLVDRERQRCVPGTARRLAGEPAKAGKSCPNQVTVKGSQGQGAPAEARRRRG